MTESLSNWLTLREPADAVARSEHLTSEIGAALGHHDRLNILDLGTGTGSNLRYLAPRLPRPQRWLVVDRDPVALGDLRAQMSRWGAAHGYDVTIQQKGLVIRGRGLDCSIEIRCRELGNLADSEIFAGRHLVTASALLDLVSESWLQHLAVRCRDSGAAVLFALTYDGRSHCSPEEPEDDTIRQLLNRHQRASDKGFGPAAGPNAVECVTRAFATAGYQMRRESSDWLLAPDMRELQKLLIVGWARAALEIAPDSNPMVAPWLARRIAHVEGGRSVLRVGHEDEAAWLPRADSPPRRVLKNDKNAESADPAENCA